jgi:hypothetical protein
MRLSSKLKPAFHQRRQNTSSARTLALLECPFNLSRSAKNALIYVKRFGGPEYDFQHVAAVHGDRVRRHL